MLKGKKGIEKIGSAKHAFYYPLIILLFVTIMAIFIPSGEYVRETIDGVTRIDPESFTIVEKKYTSIKMFFESFYHGFVNTAGMMAMLFFVGFAFGVLQDIKLMDTVVYKLTQKLSRVSFSIVTVILFVVFILFNWFTGLYDLAIVFIPMVVPLCLALGYDIMTGVAIVLVAECVGFTGATANPWFGGIAQPIAELPLYSGFGFRAFCTLVLAVPGFIYVMSYAKKVKKDPAKSVLYGLDLPYKAVDGNANLEFTPRLIVSGVAFILIFSYMIYGSLEKGFSYTELTACFAAIGFVCAIIMGKNLDEICKMMANGMKTMFLSAMVMLFARSILYILNETYVIDTIINFLSGIIVGLPKSITAVAMFILQSIINFFIPSGSGKAAITMPIMVPLADIASLNRQIACLAGQFGDGLSNFLYPTVGSLLAILAGTGIPYNKWAKWFLPLFLILTGVCVVLLVIAVQVDLGPF